MSSNISAHLVVSSDDLDFAACTAAVGIEPTKTWTGKIDSPLVSKKQWSIGFNRRQFDGVDEALDALLDMTAGHEGRFREFAESSGCRLSVVCAVTIWKDRPVYEITQAQIRWLAGMGARFLLDIFDYSED